MVGRMKLQPPGMWDFDAYEPPEVWANDLHVNFNNAPSKMMAHFCVILGQDISALELLWPEWTDNKDENNDENPNHNREEEPSKPMEEPTKPHTDMLIVTKPSNQICVQCKSGTN